MDRQGGAGARGIRMNVLIRFTARWGAHNVGERIVVDRAVANHWVTLKRFKIIGEAADEGNQSRLLLENLMRQHGEDPLKIRGYTPVSSGQTPWCIGYRGIGAVWSRGVVTGMRRN